MPQNKLITILKFLSTGARREMEKTSASFRSMKKGLKQLRSASRLTGQGLTQITMAGTATGAAVGLAVKNFAGFEQQMARVKSVITATDDEFKQLNSLAEQLGATTSFTSKQAGEAMENLARAGMSPMKIMNALPEVLKAAAAEGMDLGTASVIISDNLNAFGMASKEASRVADTLAFVSKNTSTNMAALQEGMKDAAPTAGLLGVTFEQTAASLGLLADIGIKGTNAGTAMKNSMLKMAQAQKKGTIAVGKHKAIIGETADGGMNYAQTLQNVLTALNKIDNPMERTSAAIKLFGLRGIAAVGMIKRLKKEKADLLFNRIKDEAKGVAGRMQDIQLDTLTGDFKILQSAADAAVRTLGSMFAGDLRKQVGGSKGLTAVVSEFGNALNLAISDPMRQSPKVQAELGKMSSGVVQFARGIVEGFHDAKKAIGGAIDTVKSIGKALGFTSEDGIRGITKLIVKFAGLALATAPVAIAIKGLTTLFGGFVKVGLGGLQAVRGSLNMTKGAVMGLGGVMSKLMGGKKLGILGKVFGKVGAGLGKVAGAAEKVFAQPVRVVNFDEMGAASAAGSALGGRRGKGGIKGAIVNAWTKAKGAVIGLGTALGGLLLKAKGLLAALAGPAGLVLAVGGAAVAVGRIIANLTGSDEKISNWLLGFDKRAASKRTKVHAGRAKVETGLDIGRQLTALSGRGVTAVNTGGGRREVITQELARRRTTAFAERSGFTPAQQSELLTKLETVIDSLPKEGMAFTLNAQMMLDGKRVGQLLATREEIGRARAGKKSGAGTRRQIKALGSRL